MCAHSNFSKKRSSTLTPNTVSTKSLLCTFFTLLTVVEARPKTTLTAGLSRIDPLQTINGESPNLRKILYPTYFSRDPFEMEKWEFYGGSNKAYLINPNPMSRYSDLFDRDLRSPVDYVVVEREDGPTDSQVKFESGETPEFVLEEKPGFLPFYSGRIGRR